MIIVTNIIDFYSWIVQFSKCLFQNVFYYDVLTYSFGF